MLPNATEIRYFVEVASTLNISRAAERLGVTQPTLSLAVQRLEQSLGTPLLLRTKSGVRLTKAGARFTTHAKALLEQWERLRADALSEETEIKGQVSIGCHASVAAYSVGGFAGELLRTHSELELKFHHALSRQVTERVISFEIDCGIVVNPVAHPDLRVVPLERDEVTYWRGPGAYARDVLLCDPELMQTQSLLKSAKSVGEDEGFRRVITSSSLETLARLCSSGAGVAILPTRVAKSLVGEGLRAIPKAPVFHDKICLVYRPDAQRSLAFKTVRLAIEAFFKSGRADFEA